MALCKATDVMLELLDAAIKTGHHAKYVLFDTWFSNPHQIVAIKDMGFDTIAMVKKSSKIKYSFNGKRWDIEVFFKTCKSYLRLQKECNSLSYDVITAHVSIVMVRYMILSVFQRQDEDHRALGELFFVMLTELEDITFHQSMMVLVEAMFQTVKSIFHVTEEQLEIFSADFYIRLPEYMQRALDYAPPQYA